MEGDCVRAVQLGRRDESYVGSDEQYLRHWQDVEGKKRQRGAMVVVTPRVSVHSNFNIGPVTHKGPQPKYGTSKGVAMQIPGYRVLIDERQKPNKDNQGPTKKLAKDTDRSYRPLLPPSCPAPVP